MKNIYLNFIFSGTFILITFLSLSLKAQDTPEGTVMIEDNVYLDRTEIDVGSWLSFYSWTIIHQGYEDAQKLLPDSSAVEPELWAYIKRKSNNFIDRQAIYSSQPIGYFAKDCKECDKFGKPLGSSPNNCPMLNLPVTGLTYEQVNEFCKWRTLLDGNNTFVFRLPTPDEWKSFAIKGLSESERRNGFKDSMNTKNCALYNYKIKCDCNDLAQGISVILAYYPEKTGAYEFYGNVSEMTSIKGIAKGGNYGLYAAQCHPDSVQYYSKPEPWLGFRCIAVKNISGNKNDNIQLGTPKDSASNWSVNDKFGKLLDTRDGQIYPTVRIGSQTWMAANLAYKPDSGKYWAYENEVTNVTRYGYLYTWKTAKNSCPIGWHLPAKSEYETLLETFEGNGNTAYRELMISGNSGFSIIDCGLRYGINFTPIEGGAAFWTTTEKNKRSVWGLGVEGVSHIVKLYDSYGKNSGLPVRCIKDK